jgi:hypothetical protein
MPVNEKAERSRQETAVITTPFLTRTLAGGVPADARRAP